MVPWPLFALALLGPATEASADIQFATAIPVPVGEFPVCVAIADLDGGGADLVSADFNSSSLSFVRGHGQGAFDPAGSLALPAPPHMVCAADLNGDGHLDLAALQEQGPSLVVTLLGDGTGGFGAPIPWGTGGLPTALLARDLDGDGDCDLAAAIAGAGSAHGGWIAVLRNDGAGNFAETFYRAADVQSVYAADLHAGDVDGDLDLDLAVTLDLFFDSTTIMINDGTGAFTAGPFLTANDLTVSNGLADLDGDRDEDVVLAGLSRTLWVFFNDGAGAFSGSAPQSAPTSMGIINRFALTDLDGDSRPDLVLPQQDVPNAGTLVLENGGSGDFSVAGSFPAAGGDVPTFVAAGYLDGNASVDIAVADRATDRLYVFLASNDLSDAAEESAPYGLSAFPSPVPRGRSATILARPPLGSTRARLLLTDVHGRRVRSWSAENAEDGWTVEWNGRDEAGNLSAPGVYFATARSGAWSRGIKILLLPR